MTRYIDPKTDFGFKRLFAQEDSKDILIVHQARKGTGWHSDLIGFTEAQIRQR